MSEHAMWQYIRIGIQHAGDVVRVEAPEQGCGTPDVNYCLRGVEGNLELKYWQPSKGFTLRANQYRWFQRRVEAEGNCWVLAEYNDGKEHWFALINGRYVRQLMDDNKASTWYAMSEHIWHDKVDFDELIEYLTGIRVVYKREIAV